jgi:hypothetical protein
MDRQPHIDRPQRPTVTGRLRPARSELEQRLPVLASTPERLQILLAADGETHQPVTRRREGIATSSDINFAVR